MSPKRSVTHDRSDKIRESLIGDRSPCQIRTQGVLGEIQTVVAADRGPG